MNTQIIKVDDQDVETELDGIAEQFSSREAMVEELEKANVSMELLHRSVRREIRGMNRATPACNHRHGRRTGHACLRE